LIWEILFNTETYDDVQKKYKLIEKSILEVGFKSTANIYSVSNTAKLGGQVGWIDESQLSGIIKKEISKLKVGEYTKPITIPGGFLIILLSGKKTENVYLNFDEELEKQITYEKNTQLEQYSTIYFKKIKKNSVISEK
jgi:peptidyl-prolyl cis-trans isomerase SurA